MDKNTFYNASHANNELNFVPFDIETTGFNDEDVITAFTLLYNNTYNVFLNTDGRSVEESLEAALDGYMPTDVALHVHEDDGALLESVTEFIREGIDSDNTVFIAYNGEMWNGGFDLRTIRTCCLVNNVSFPFSGYGYSDLMPIFGKHDRFNITHKTPEPDLGDIFTRTPLNNFADYLSVSYTTTMNKGEVVDAIEENGYDESEVQEYCEMHYHYMPTQNPTGLVQVYNRIAHLADWNTLNIDPFGPEESAKAVDAYENGDFETLLLHNMADVHKTDRLTTMVTESKSISKNEYEPKFFPAD
jgi:hypothetical protein